MKPRTRERLIGLAAGVISALTVMGVIEIATDAPSSAQTPRIQCMPDEHTREQVRTLLLEGLDEALKSRVEHVFDVWMKSAYDKGQPERAAEGVRQAVRAYVASRAFTLAWNPPVCPT